VEIVRALGIHAFMDDEVFPVFLTGQRVGAIRALKGKGPGETVLIRREKGPADFAHQLAGFAVIAVQVRLGSLAGRTGAILRNVALGASPHGFDRLSVFPCVVTVEILPVPVLMMVDNLRELIDLEPLILGGMGIVEGPLLERDISTDKVDQPAVLLIKLMA